MRPPETFDTARLHARPPRAEDAPAAFAAYASDLEATRFLAWKAYADVESLAAFFSACAAAWREVPDPEDLVHYPWLLFLRDGGALVGSIALDREPGRVSFGYVLSRPQWGCGYAAEALRPLVDWALAQEDVYRAWAYCDVENPASARVMEKAGMTREGILRRWHVCPNISDEPRDCLVYAKTR